MSETTADLADRIDYDEKVNNEYVFYREDDTRFTLRLMSYGCIMKAGDVRFYATEIKLTEGNVVEVYDGNSYISSFQAEAIPDDMFEALKIIADDK